MRYAFFLAGSILVVKAPLFDSKNQSINQSLWSLRDKISKYQFNHTPPPYLWRGFFFGSRLLENRLISQMYYHFSALSEVLQSCFSFCAGVNLESTPKIYRAFWQIITSKFKDQNCLYRSFIVVGWCGLIY